jgi:transcriptional regulator with XRE-family HTH domain
MEIPMEKKSLRVLAKESGVSHSYLSQVISGKRPPSDRVLTILLTNGLLKNNNLQYNESIRQRSSVVEQRFRKPSVASSTLAVGSRFRSYFQNYVTYHNGHLSFLLFPCYSALVTNGHY